MAEDLRKTEKLQEDGTWKQLRLADVKKGDTFRMFEVADGREGGGQQLGGPYVAIADGYIDPATLRGTIQVDHDVETPEQLLRPSTPPAT